VIYIPAVLMAGLVLGWILGARSVRTELADRERRRLRREQREAAEAAQDAADAAKATRT
jgi:hypothetical protein